MDKENIIRDLIDMILQAPKYLDGTLKNEKEILEKFSEGCSCEGITCKGAKNPFTKKPIKLPLCCSCGLNNDYCPIHGEWEEEFDDRIYYDLSYNSTRPLLSWLSLGNIMRKYLEKGKIKIKARKGCIQIERMD